ncbi:MAG TPA: DNA adenine methylase [Candidatus Kapabacteria bacterium]|jgi:DNA adenine methylase
MLLTSPLPWVGGKSRLRQTIISRIPTHHCYVEVFAGGAWVYFGKPPSKVEVLNDINGDLVNLYKVLQSRHDEFYEALWYMFPSRQLHKDSKAILEANRTQPILTDVERAVLFYYQIKYAFGARYGAGYALSSIRPPRHLIAHDLLNDFRSRLENTHVENLSYERLIASYDKPETFFYCDPPYVVADGGDYYQFCFSPEDHTSLRDALANAKGKWLLSYDDVPMIRSLYHDFKITVTKEIPYSLNNRKGKVKRKRELLISNY